MRKGIPNVECHMRSALLRNVWFGLIGLWVTIGCSGPRVHYAAGDTTRDEKTIRIPSDDVKGIDLVIQCGRPIPQSGYSAETDSGVPLDSAYALEREVHLGQVYMMKNNERQRREKAFQVSKDSIRYAINIRYDMDVLDKMDLLLTNKGLVVVHTYTTNAGIFTSSDVWELLGATRLSELPQPIRKLAQHGFDACDKR